MDASKTRQLKGLLEQALALLDDDPQPHVTPANVVPIKADDEELTGDIYRPELKTVKGKQLFTAGLKREDGSWVSLESWGKAAEAMSHIGRGESVTVRGKTKHDSYLDQDGAMRHKITFVVKTHEFVTLAASA